MKITYKHNPLDTVVELDQHDREVLRLKIMIRSLQDDICHMRYMVEHDDSACVEDSLSALSKYAVEAYAKIWGPEGDYPCSANEKYADEVLAYYEDELKLSHDGDCVCQPSTCGKCSAEELLGINTIEGLDQHQAVHVAGCTGTADEIIAKLEAFDPYKECLWGTPDSAPANSWKAEATKAAEWLKAYKAKHGDSLTL